MGIRHSPQIIAYLDRATGFCACGFNTGELFGDRRTATAKQGLLLHLESAIAAEHDEYHIRDGSPLECPLCKSDLDLAPEDTGLLTGTTSSLVVCDEGHEFDAYYAKRTLFLFVKDGAFS